MTGLVTAVILVGWLFGFANGVGGDAIHLALLVGMILFLGATSFADPSLTRK